MRFGLDTLLRVGVAAASLGLLSVTSGAQAGEGSFGWVYTLDLQPQGTWEFEQRVQYNRGQAGGRYDLWQARTEVEYGVTQDFQVAAYLNSSRVVAERNYPASAEFPRGETAGWGVSTTGDQAYARSRVEGGSIEAIYRLSNPVLAPVGVGLYGEITTGRVKDELETRLLLQSNFLDDRLVLAANLVAAVERIKFIPGETTPESMVDLLLGASYRVANRWTAGLEARFHNDFYGYRYNAQTQRAWFVGPNVHYATKDWWLTAAWRYQPKGGQCWSPGEAECSQGRVWDSHTRNEFIVKVGVPF